MEFNLTDEQKNAIELALTGDSLKIEAYAGAGKTSTLSAIAEVMPGKRGLYIAFNKSIADDAARKFPKNVDCRTAHSAAYRAVGNQYGARLGRIKGAELAKKYLNLKSGIFDLTAAATGYFILDAVTNFCRSSEIEIQPWHLPKKTVDQIEEVLKIDKEDIVNLTLPYARRVWEQMTDINSNFPITHDVYLKIWALQRPQIDVDFILFDESQDANGVLLDLVQFQGAQQIYVGDKYQSIYGWRGAVNAMEKIDTDNECKISQSFRFGQEIADVANLILHRNGVHILGYSAINSRVCRTDEPSAIISRTNASLIESIFRRLTKREKVYVAGGVADLLSFVKGAKNLQEGQLAFHKDLFIFKDWGEVVDYSQTEAGSDMAGMVKIIEEYDIDNIISALELCKGIKERDADIILTTTHKAKGRQWDKVQLENDFRHITEKTSQEEVNILYVAATRAISVLDISAVSAYRKLKYGESED